MVSGLIQHNERITGHLPICRDELRQYGTGVNVLSFSIPDLAKKTSRVLFGLHNPT
jgi:hypothetical protein